LIRIINGDAAQKTLFLFDPSAKDLTGCQAVASVILPLFETAGLATRGFAFESHALGFYFDADELVEIKNVHWTATSYRTAFSHFLASRCVRLSKELNLEKFDVADLEQILRRARKVAATRYIEDGEALVKELGGTLSYEETGRIFKTRRITVKVLGDERQFASSGSGRTPDYEMVQWVISRGSSEGTRR
jgi:hypothetical protein